MVNDSYWVMVDVWRCIVVLDDAQAFSKIPCPTTMSTALSILPVARCLSLPLPMFSLPFVGSRWSLHLRRVCLSTMPSLTSQTLSAPLSWCQASATLGPRSGVLDQPIPHGTSAACNILACTSSTWPLLRIPTTFSGVFPYLAFAVSAGVTPSGRVFHVYCFQWSYPCQLSSISRSLAPHGLAAQLHIWCMWVWVIRNG